jgi:hypothetical protein
MGDVDGQRKIHRIINSQQLKIHARLMEDGHTENMKAQQLTAASFSETCQTKASWAPARAESNVEQIISSPSLRYKDFTA